MFKEPSIHYHYLPFRHCGFVFYLGERDAAKENSVNKRQIQLK